MWARISPLGFRKKCTCVIERWMEVFFTLCSYTMKFFIRPCALAPRVGSPPLVLRNELFFHANIPPQLFTWKIFIYLLRSLVSVSLSSFIFIFYVFFSYLLLPFPFRRRSEVFAEVLRPCLIILWFSNLKKNALFFYLFKYNM